MSDEGLRHVLARHGYRIRFREHEWVECLIASAAESFAGTGLDRASALQAALAKCFPSRVARELFEVAVAAASRTLPVPADAETASPPEAHPAPAPSPSPPPPEPRARVPISSPRVAPLPPAARPVVRSGQDRVRALDELAILTDRIEESRDELAWSTAPRQRLAILAWICEARSHTDLFPEDLEIRESVARVSRQLTEIGKAFWPGSVTALQLQMQPSDLPRHLLGGSPATWARAAELAERALASLEYGDERRGHDPYGWSDSSALSPEPSQPSSILEGLVSAVEEAWGPLDRFAEPRNPEDLPDPVLYQRWVRELRWIRVQHVDPDRWARVMGRLRWWACRRNGPVQAEGRELEPTFRPERPWSRLLEQDGLQRPELPLPEELVEKARHRYDGKRLLLVGNRRDPVEQERLRRALPTTELEWRFPEPKLLDAVPRAVSDGAFDVVLGAVGLQSPGLDLALARGCRSVSVPYLRTNRGQPLACLRALARVS
ncbi:MAG: hypothetical protein AAFZ18_05210 [Myxococcota bacterium]